MDDQQQYFHTAAHVKMIAYVCWAAFIVSLSVPPVLGDSGGHRYRPSPTSHQNYSLRRRADDSNTVPSAESLGVESATAGIDSTVSTKITEDGNSCIETGGYANSVYSGSGGDVEGVNGNNKLEALWVEFDYQLETPFYVQSSFNTKDRIEAVESLMHATLAEELLGCDDEDGTYVYNDNDGNSIAAMPRLDESMGRSNAGSGIELVAGISTSPTDIQIGE
mmetsp:Transcript_35492/g.71948  ORF Transcript_35492/g.71948 Transcript_35492/m.71948 type:complete len:221 (-) Transcript_35492:1406-2068(-)